VSPVTYLTSYKFRSPEIAQCVVDDAFVSQYCCSGGNEQWTVTLHSADVSLLSQHVRS
jgi:hypothetical protein